DQAEATIAAFSGELAENFFGLATLINNAEFLARALQAVIVGEREDEGTQKLLRALYGHCLPDLVLQVIEPGDSLPEGHPAAGKGQTGGKATAYLCRGATCSLPITDPAELERALST
ncbi:MAG: thioredoxin domain-containing protein, partial [Kiloniellales bacterium]